MSETGLSPKLSEAERSTLNTLAETVVKGQRTFMEVGSALMRIRDERLWREESGTFETFCQLRFQISRRHADRLIEAVEVAAEIENGPIGPTAPPTNEAQSRELSKAPKGERAEVWKEAVETAPKDDKGKPKVTAQHVSKVVAKRKAPDLAPDPTPAPTPVVEFKPEPESVPERCGQGGTPAEVVASATLATEPWAEFNAEINAILTDLRSISIRLGKVLGAQTKAKKLTARWAHFYAFSGTHGELLNLIRNLEDGMPGEATTKNEQGFIPMWRVEDAKKTRKAG